MLKRNPVRSPSGSGNNNSGVIFIETTPTNNVNVNGNGNGNGKNSSINNNTMPSPTSSSPLQKSSSSSSPAASNGKSSSSNGHAAADSSSTSSSSNANATLSMSSFKLLLLALMVLQNSSCVLVGRYSRSNTSNKAEEDDLYVVNHLLVIIELGKLTLSLLLEYWTTQRSVKKLWQTVHHHCLANPYDALKITIPALLYLVQNSLLYVALGNLTAPIFQVTYQAKLVTTALVSVILLQRSYTIQQWICLLGLSLGVATVVLGETTTASDSSKNGSGSGGGNLLVGLVAVTISCFSSALAGVYFEMVLKKNTIPSSSLSNGTSSAASAAAAQPSLWIRNVQLAFFSVVIALCQGWYDDFQAGRFSSHSSSSTAATSDSSSGHKSYFHGFTFWVWVLVAMQAGGGLLVAAVIKYADNVLKGLATGVSVVLSSTLSMMLFATPLGWHFLLGATVILISVWYFSEPCPYAVQQFCARKCQIHLNASWGYKSLSSSLSLSSSSSDDTKSLLPK